MKILILSIYNETPWYKTMLEWQQKYIHLAKQLYSNVDYYFITYNPNQEKNILIDDEKYIISIKGNEGLLNITHKTIQSLEYLMNLKYYDFIIRTNVSTIVNITNLVNYLNAETMQKTNLYIGGKIECMRWLDEPAGINPDSYSKYNLLNLNYIQGNGIIFSNDIATSLISYKNEIIHEIVDDVTIGLLIRSKFPPVYDNLVSYTQNERSCVTNLMTENAINVSSTDAIFIKNRTFRNENIDRQIDITRMTNILQQLIFDIKRISLSSFPKIIHLTHKTTDLLQKSYNTWSQLNPEYEIRLYDNEKCLQELHKHFGELHCNIFNYIQDGPIKSDFFRLCILYIYGGVYADNDIVPYIPLRDFVEPDVDFLTCISYNYTPKFNIYNYNPHFMIAKPFNQNLYNIILKYVEMYVNNVEYTYWSWSICKHMTKIYNFNFTSSGNNIFFLDKQKYQFSTETVEINNNIYDFSNFRELDQNAHKGEPIKVFCNYKGIQILNNFANK